MEAATAEGARRKEAPCGPPVEAAERAQRMLRERSRDDMVRLLGFATALGSAEVDEPRLAGRRVPPTVG